MTDLPEEDKCRAMPAKLTEDDIKAAVQPLCETEEVTTPQPRPESEGAEPVPSRPVVVEVTEIFGPWTRRLPVPDGVRTVARTLAGPA
jgi:hypothetical protein